jgi:NTE family protein
MGLALGGGGARGLAHIGVLKVLGREEIPIDLIVGTSIGALVGGAFASGMSPEEIESRVDEYLQSPEFESSAIKAFEAAQAAEGIALPQRIQRFFKNRFYMIQALFRPGLLSKEDFQATINYFIPDILIEETRTPYHAVATDLIRGEPIIFSSGSLRQAVAASCAVPGAVEPLKKGARLLSDGGIMCLVPCSVAREEGADIVLAVSVERHSCSGNECRTVLGIYYRASEIMADRLQRYELMDADVVVAPAVGDLHWSSFSRARDLIEEGEKATNDKLEEIRNAAYENKKWIRSILRQIPMFHKTGIKSPSRIKRLSANPDTPFSTFSL